MKFTPILTLPTGGKVSVGEPMLQVVRGDVMCATLARNVFLLNGYSGGGAAYCVIDIEGLASQTVDYSLGDDAYADVSDILKGLFVRGGQTSGTKYNTFYAGFNEYDSDGVSLGSVYCNLIVSDREDYLCEQLFSGCTAALPLLPSRCWLGILAVGADSQGLTVKGFAAGVQTSSVSLDPEGSVQVWDVYADELRLVDSGGNVVRKIAVESVSPATYIRLKWWSLRQGAWKVANAEVLDHSVTSSQASDYETVFDDRRGLDISEGFRCRISGLDGNDYRYYSDLLIADDVSISGVAVRVTGDTQPMRGGGQDIEFTVEYLRESNL